MIRKPSVKRWRTVYGKYHVSNCGDVWSLRKNCLLKLHKDRKGYERVQLEVSSGIWRNIRVHQLVALAFVGPKPFADAQVNHRDGVKSHNWSSNVEYVTNRQNAMHAIIMGTKKALSVSQAAHIRRLHRRGAFNMSELADFYQVSVTYVSSIVRGLSWHSQIAPAKVGVNYLAA